MRAEKKKAHSISGHVKFRKTISRRILQWGGVAVRNRGICTCVMYDVPLSTEMERLDVFFKSDDFRSSFLTTTSIKIGKR